MIVTSVETSRECKRARFGIGLAREFCSNVALGMMILPGWLQETLGCQRFFIWVMIATIPGFVVTSLIKIDPAFGRKTTPVTRPARIPAMNPHLRRFACLAALCAAIVLAGCYTARPRTFVPRKGDEIVVAGQLFHTGTRVVTWMDPGGYDAFRVERLVQGTELMQYDLTPQQYKALTKLTAALCKIFPKIACDYPRDAEGKLVAKKLPEEQLKNFGGVIGHFHIQTDKTDPGPAFDWDRVIGDARRMLGLAPVVPVAPAARALAAD